jgi:hypothetical protein
MTFDNSEIDNQEKTLIKWAVVPSWIMKSNKLTKSVKKNFCMKIELEQSQDAQI